MKVKNKWRNLKTQNQTMWNENFWWKHSGSSEINREKFQGNLYGEVFKKIKGVSILNPDKSDSIFNAYTNEQGDIEFDS